MVVSVTFTLGCVVFGFAVFVFSLRVRRRRRSLKVDIGPTDFGIDQLRALLHQGKLTPEEFERARASVLSRRRSEGDDPGRRRGFEVLEPRDPV